MQRKSRTPTRWCLSCKSKFNYYGAIIVMVCFRLRDELRHYEDVSGDAGAPRERSRSASSTRSHTSAAAAAAVNQSQASSIAGAGSRLGEHQSEEYPSPNTSWSVSSMRE